MVLQDGGEKGPLDETGNREEEEKSPKYQELEISSLLMSFNPILEICQDWKHSKTPHKTKNKKITDN